VGTFRTTRGLHNKPLGCSASGAYALGPDEKKKKRRRIPAIKQMTSRIKRGRRTW